MSEKISKASIVERLDLSAHLLQDRESIALGVRSFTRTP
jgi:hypothetical protein